MGGQHNEYLGAYSEYIMGRLCGFGADAIVGTHPHIIQRLQITDEVPQAFCLGSYSITPNNIYVPKGSLPEYGIMLHFYLDEGKIHKVSFSVIKSTEDKALSVWSTEMLIKKKLKSAKAERLQEEVALACKRFWPKMDVESIRKGELEYEYQVFAL